MIQVGRVDRERQQCAVTIRIPVLAVVTVASLRRLADATPGSIENTPTEGRVYLSLETAAGNVLRCVADIALVDAIRNAIRRQID